jgi:hypothetical protein
MFLFRALAVWLVLMATEVVHGILRALLLVPVVGDFRFRQIGVLTGSLLILGLTYLFIRWIRASTTARLLAVGLLWLVLTVLFEIGLGRLVLGLPWEQMRQDYDLPRGGLMPLGLLILTFSPLLMSRWRRSGQDASAVEPSPFERSRPEESGPSGPRGDEPIRSDRS